jgi:hypothetical protein
MRIVRIIAPALLALLAVPAAADPIAAHDEQESIRETGRQEIARILAADNVDASRLSTRQVATAIRAIPRGAAPDDFWTAYQAHVRAWERAADAEERAMNMVGAKPAEMEGAIAAFVAAQAEIAATFEQVRQIATGYGVEMPIPPAEAANTV